MAFPEDIAVQAHMTERSMSWHNAVTACRRTFEDAILTRDTSFSLEQLPHTPMITDLFSPESCDPMILKLHLASIFSSCTDIAVAQGLPRALAHGIKDVCFQSLTHENRIEEIPRLVDHCMQELIQALQEHCKNQYSHTVLMATTFIYQNLYQNIHPADVSAYLQKERTYLSKRFRQETGLTLSAYIRRAKITRARQLISQHLYTLTEISGMLGYSDYSSFYRDFRRETGISPGEFSF